MHIFGDTRVRDERVSLQRKVFEKRVHICWTLFRQGRFLDAAGIYCFQKTGSRSTDSILMSCDLNSFIKSDPVPSGWLH